MGGVRAECWERGAVNARKIDETLRMKVGVLGGSFNPVHFGHLAVARAARDAHRLERVLFVPAGTPPHKRADLADAKHRLEMVRLAIEGVSGFEVSDVEIARPGPSYTVDTLEELHRREPDAELFFIMGADSVSEFRSWRAPERILSLARIVVVNRPGARGDFNPEDYPDVSREIFERIERDRVSMEDCPIEARLVREAIRSGRSIDGLVPRRVAEYIRRHGLYQAKQSAGS